MTDDDVQARRIEADARFAAVLTAISRRIRAWENGNGILDAYDLASAALAAADAVDGQLGYRVWRKGSDDPEDY